MGLGWLRLALSLLVIDAHYGGFRTLLQPRLVDAFGVERLAYIGEGEVAIAGFFVISGYVITYVLARKYDTASWRGIGIFYLGRALRIYPLYLLVFALYWAALAASGAPPALHGAQLANNLLLLPLGVMALLADHVTLGAPQFTGQLLIGPAWTLCFDLLLYVLAPFFVLRKRALAVAW
jgi:peptidoglycan/LPS O-acetylase OafA/YrhL